MSSTAKGFATKAGAKPSSVWGTPVACGANDQFEFSSESLTPDAQFIADEQMNGSAVRQFGDKGNEFHSGEIEMDFRYEGVERFLAQAFGTAGAPAQQGATAAYKHTFDPATDRTGKHLTVILDKQVAVWEYTTCKVNGFKLGIENGKRAMLTFPIIPQGLNINTGSGTNTTATAANLSLPSNREFALFSHRTILINDQSAGALAASDEVYVSGFEFEMNPNLATDDVTTQFGYLVDEPVEDGFCDFTGKLTFSRYHDNAGGNASLVAYLLSKARKKMSVTLVGSQISGAYYNTIELLLPDLQFTEGSANIGAAGRVPLELSFSCSRVLSAPTGMTGVLLPRMNLTNRRTTDALT